MCLVYNLFGFGGGSLLCDSFYEDLGICLLWMSEDLGLGGYLVDDDDGV